MSDFELETRLKSVPVPERTEEYWDEFPFRVRLKLRDRRTEAAPRPGWGIRILWAPGAAIAAALALVCIQYHPLQTASAAVARHQHYVQVQFARLDAGLHKLMLNTDGMGYLLSDAN